MPKISVELSDAEYAKLHTLKYQISVPKNGTRDTLSTHAAILRAGFRLLCAAHEAVQEGGVVGVASGPKQRVRKVFVVKRWKTELEL